MIPFNRASLSARELALIAESLASSHISGNGPYTTQAESMLSTMHSGSPTLLTTSCTHALEMSGRLLNLKPGDEVIVPAYSFVSTASAYLWNGARPVFADVREDTFSLDLDSAMSRVTSKTRAICLVHYAGIPANAESFSDFCRDAGLVLIEDNAHGLGALEAERPLGTFGAMSTLSFHETKNVTCGEGGALVLNDELLLERAEILREKGTDRSRFFRGQVDKYTWVDSGSSWVPSDLLAAILVAQLEQFQQIRAARLHVWREYENRLADWAKTMNVKVPRVQPGDQHAAHIYFLVFERLATRAAFIEHMRSRGIMVVFHYQSLKDSPFGQRVDPSGYPCPVSQAASETLVRLPIFRSMTEENINQVVEAVLEFDTRP